MGAAVTHLALCILALVVVWDGRQVAYAPQLRRHELGAEERALQLALWVEEAARQVEVDPYLLAALLHLESAWNGHAVHETSGAYGLGQLNPRSRYSRRLEYECRRSPTECEARSVYWAAVVLRLGVDGCQGEWAGVGWYRSGRCVEGPRGRQVLALRRKLSRLTFGQSHADLRLTSRSRPMITGQE